MGRKGITIKLKKIHVNLLDYNMYDFTLFGSYFSHSSKKYVLPTGQILDYPYQVVSFKWKVLQVPRKT